VGEPKAQQPTYHGINSIYYHIEVDDVKNARKFRPDTNLRLLDHVSRVTTSYKSRADLNPFLSNAMRRFRSHESPVQPIETVIQIGREGNP
jgi:hypothetical protein